MIGFVHEYCTLDDEVELVYKVSGSYAPACAGGIRWDNPTMCVNLPIGPGEAVLSTKGARLSLLHEWENRLVDDEDPRPSLAPVES